MSFWVSAAKGTVSDELKLWTAEGDDSAVFGLQAALEEVYDRIEAASSGGASPFTPAAEGSSTSATSATGRSQTQEILSSVWEDYRVGGKRPESQGASPNRRGLSKDDSIRRLADGRQAVHVRLHWTRLTLRPQSRSPITYFPALLGLLGPQVIPVYRAALTGKRIVSPEIQIAKVGADGPQLIYSTPPLLPLAAFAWCIAASSLSPRSCDAGTSAWLGNIGLMDLQALKSRQGGWVASKSGSMRQGLAALTHGKRRRTLYTARTKYTTYSST